MKDYCSVVSACGEDSLLIKFSFLCLEVAVFSHITRTSACLKDLRREMYKVHLAVSVKNAFPQCSGKYQRIVLDLSCVSAGVQLNELAVVLRQFIPSELNRYLEHPHKHKLLNEVEYEQTSQTRTMVQFQRGVYM